MVLEEYTKYQVILLTIVSHRSVYSLEEEECRSNLGATKSELLDHYQVSVVVYVCSEQQTN